MQTETTFVRKVSKLISTSRKRPLDAFQPLEYPDALDTGRLTFPEALVSLYYHPIYRTLSDEQKWQLGLLETVNFFSMNIHGERALIIGLESRLYRNRMSWESNHASEYMQHFIHEENAHSYMLAGYCNRYYGRVMADYNLHFNQTMLSSIGEDLLFFGRLYVLEMWLAYLNKVAMNDKSLDETTRTIHTIHHHDEAKHLAFDKAVLHEIVQQARHEGLHHEILYVSRSLADYKRYVIRRLSDANIYRAVGIEGGRELIREMSDIPERRSLEVIWMAQCDAQLEKLGLIEPL